MRFRIEKEFEKLPRWWKTEFAKLLWTSLWNINKIYREWKPTFRTMEKHTEAFNELAWTKYVYNYLFEKIEENE